LTAHQAAALAAEANVKTLILTHVSRRYRESAILDEARRVFPNTTVARDLDHYVVRRDKPPEKIAPEVVRARALAAEEADADNAQ
jgi:ribonuclease Z